jgi:hypothetical protein
MTSTTTLFNNHLCLFVLCLNCAPLNHALHLSFRLQLSLEVVSVKHLNNLVMRSFGSGLGLHAGPGAHCRGLWILHGSRADLWLVKPIGNFSLWPRISSVAPSWMIEPISSSSSMETPTVTRIWSIKSSLNCVSLASTARPSGGISYLPRTRSVVVRRCTTLIHPATYNVGV